MRTNNHHSSEPPKPKKAVRINILSREDQLAVLNLLVEGNSLRSITRLTGIHRTTILKLLVRVGRKCREFLDRKMRGLQLEHVECDEIWTFVLKKQARLSYFEQDNPDIGDQFLFVALDQRTKLIPSFVIGKRNREVTEMFIQDLSERLVAPQLHEAGPRPQLSTDGWAAYRGAVDLAFASTVTYGQIIKNFQETEQPGRYGPPEIVATDRRPITKGLDPMTICTSHVERHNLSIRTFMKRFTRLALGFSKKLENLAATVALYVAHYNFCRWHGSLKMTPAMASKITGHPWTMDELLGAVESE